MMSSIDARKYEPDARRSYDQLEGEAVEHDDTSEVNLVKDGIGIAYRAIHASTPCMLARGIRYVAISTVMSSVPSQTAVSRAPRTAPEAGSGDDSRDVLVVHFVGQAVRAEQRVAVEQSKCSMSTCVRPAADDVGQMCPMSWAAIFGPRAVDRPALRQRRSWSAAARRL